MHTPHGRSSLVLYKEAMSSPVIPARIQIILWLDVFLALVLVVVITLNFAMFERFGPSGPALPLRKLAQITLPYSISEFGPSIIDTKHDRLFVSHTYDQTVDVVNTRLPRLIGTTTTIQLAGALAVAQQSGRVFVAEPPAGDVVVIDGERSAIIGRIANTGRIVALQSDPTSDSVISARENGLLSILDPEKFSRRYLAQTGGRPGGLTFDANERDLLVTLANSSTLVRVDLHNGRILSREGLAGCSGAGTIIVDSPRRVAFIACTRLLPHVIIYDLRSRSITASADSPYHVESLAFDGAKHRLYAAGSNGVVAAYDVRTSALVRISQDDVHSRNGGIVVDPRTHRIFLPLSSNHGIPTLLIEEAVK